MPYQQEVFKHAESNGSRIHKNPEVVFIMNGEKLSVIVPVYKAEGFIAKNLPEITRVDIEKVLKALKHRTYMHDPSFTYRYTDSAKEYFAEGKARYASVATSDVIDNGLS